MFKKLISLFLIALLLAASATTALAAPITSTTSTTPVLTPAQAAAAAAKAPIPKTVDYVLTKEDYMLGEGIQEAQDEIIKRNAAATKAAQSLTTFKIDHKTNFSATIKGTTLVFSNIPADLPYTTVKLRKVLSDDRIDTKSYVSNTTYTKGSNNSGTLDLSKVPDGTYHGGFVGKSPSDGIIRIFNFYIVVKDKKLSFEFLSKICEDNYISWSGARSDIYAIEAYKTRTWVADKYYKKANEITKGITDDYEKAKAIFLWIADNITYSKNGEGIDLENNRNPGFPVYGTCETYALVTQQLMYAAGLPVKKVGGSANNGFGWEGHAWNEVYVDDRWVIIDTTWGDDVLVSEALNEFGLPVDVDWFDISPYNFSTHISNSDIEYMGTRLWDGRVYFAYKSTGDIIKTTVDPVPYGSLLTSTFGYDPNMLYAKDAKWNFATDRITATNYCVWVDTPAPVFYSVIFEPNGGSYKGTTRPVAYFIDSVEGLKEGSKIPAPPTLTKQGYTFGGWYSDKAFKRPFNISKDVVSGKIANDGKVITLYAKWVKK